MKIAELKALLEEFNSDDEFTLEITLDDDLFLCTPESGNFETLFSEDEDAKKSLVLTVNIEKEEVKNESI